ncbi:hypothetical protein LguiA_026506 [Lonicera macranthoides]
MAGASSQSFPFLCGCSHHIKVVFKDDTVNTFPGRLIADLRQAGFRTLQGDQMTDSARHSNICIIIISNDYVSSREHLDEFVKILDFYAPSRIVPVYYNVDRSDVRHQLGSVGEAFSVFESGKEDDGRLLREALKKLDKIPGYYVGNVTNGGQSEEEMIEKIVREMGVKVYRVVSGPNPVLVGLDSRAHPINRWLKKDTLSTSSVWPLRGRF